jgi:hypothetical protein
MGRSIWLEDESVVKIAADPRQRSHFQVRVPRDSWPYFTVSNSRLPFSSPSMTRRAMVEVFDPSSTRDNLVFWVWVILRPTVSRPVCPGTKHPYGAYDQIFITVWPLRCFDMGRTLWREDGSVFYNVQYTIYFTVSDFRPGSCIYIPQEQGGPVIPPGTR